MICYGYDINFIGVIEQKLCKRFSIKIIRPVKKYKSGSEIDHKRNCNTTRLIHTKFMKEFAKKFCAKCNLKIFSASTQTGSKFVK